MADFSELIDEDRDGLPFLLFRPSFVQHASFQVQLYVGSALGEHGASFPREENNLLSKQEWEGMERKLCLGVADSCSRSRGMGGQP